MTLNFEKVEATGNDFLFIDARLTLPGRFAQEARSSLAKRMCDRHFGVGADGVVFIEKGRSEDSIKWDFFNSDGSVAEMCGNASRCVGRWALGNLHRNSVFLETQPGKVRIEIVGELVASHLEYLKIESRPLVYSNGRVATLVNTGVPHAVVEIDNLAKARQSLEVIRELRTHPEAGPRGANVTFYRRVPRAEFEEFETVTFERGVEDFTLSCGTGVLAAAAVGLSSTANRRAKVSAPGGRLEVSFADDWAGATLLGPARTVFHGILTEEFLR